MKQTYVNIEINEMNDASPYDYFDDIVCINLKHRPDRRAYAEGVFKQMGITPRFYLADKHPKGGLFGCFESHTNVMKQCLQSGCQRILVFEDDIKLTPSYSLNKVGQGVNFMKRHPEWDLFYYGYIVSNYTANISMAASTDDKQIVRYTPLANHAYCVNRPAMERIVAMSPSYIGKLHIDEFLSSHDFKSFCIVPMLFEQMHCIPNDNPGSHFWHSCFVKMSCLIDKTQLNYNVSLVLAALENKTLTSTLCSVIVAVIVLMLVFMRPNK